VIDAPDPEVGLEFLPFGRDRRGPLDLEGADRRRASPDWA
jgi:hypothetical protein